jgi:membrane protein YqaA with SNARE-associated domain
MSLWLLITLALTLQEGLSVLAVLLRAYQLQYSLWVIHAIWLAVTIIQITVAYHLGKWIQKRFKESKFERWAEKSAHKLETSIDKNGEKLALVLLSSIISPAIAAFLASWLEIPFSSIFVFTLLGDAFWYASTWATVLGAFQIISVAKYGLLIVIGLAIIFVLISHFRKNKTVL